MNSQSGKGGVAYLLRTHHGLDLPPRLRPDFSRVVQEWTDDSGREATPKELYDLFRQTYAVEEPLKPGDHQGAGTPHALVEALADAGFKVDILESAQDGTAAYAECRVNGVTAWGAGEGPAASVQAVPAAVNRAVR